MLMKEHNDRVDALNLKSALVFRAMVAKQQYENAMECALWYKDYIKEQLDATSAENLTWKLSAWEEELKRRMDYADNWYTQMSIFSGYAIKYGLYDDPDVDLVYLEVLLHE